MSVSARLQARVERDFEAGSVAAVLSRLAGRELPRVRAEDAEVRERIQAAVVLRAGADWPRFEREAAAAEVDWRDVLLSAGLADDDWRLRLEQRLGPGQAS